jgi:hypothetical protein
MMLRKQVTVGLAALVITLTAYGQTATVSTSGYNLYSWKIKGHWYYSLVSRSSGLKTYEEITAPSLVRRDASGLAAELQKLRKGEEVYWLSDAPAGARRSTTTRGLDLKHPSSKRIKGVKELCDRLGITLKLA